MIRRLLGGRKPDLVLNIAEGRGISRSRGAACRRSLRPWEFLIPDLIR